MKKNKTRRVKIIDDHMVCYNDTDDLYNIETLILNETSKKFDEKIKLIDAIKKSNEESLISLPIYTDTKTKNLYNNQMYNLISQSLTLERLEFDLFSEEKIDNE